MTFLVAFTGAALWYTGGLMTGLHLDVACVLAPVACAIGGVMLGCLAMKAR